jgi:tetratricopeptide (TPR) repeat protein
MKAFTLLLLVMIPAGLGAEEPPAALASARTLLNQDRPQEAIDALRGLDESDPKVALLLGVAQYHAGDAVRAVALLQPAVEKLVEGSDERREAAQVLGLSLYLIGHITEAVPWLEATQKWAAANPELNQVLGDAYIQTRQPDKAREALARAFGVSPEGAAAHLLAAQMMLRLEQEAMAETELQKAVAKDARLPQAHFLLGEIALFRARFPEAEAFTRSELEINPAHNQAWSQLGDIYVRQQKWDDAIPALQRSIWISPFYSAPYILLGRAYMRKGQPTTAEPLLRRALEYDPNNKTAHYLLGQLLQQAGRTEEARKELEAAQRLKGADGR